MAREKINIPTEKKEKIKNICARRMEGQFGDPVIKDDLKKFVETDLKEKFYEPGLKSRMGERAYEKHLELYRAYEDFALRLPPTTITRAFREGVSRSAIVLLELFDLYIEQYDPAPKPLSNTSLKLPSLSDDFSFETAYYLKERAISRCSFDNCPHPTSGPVMKDSKLFLPLGKAVCIYGVYPEQPRYDASKPQQPDDINNAIWLCRYHAYLVNAEDGKDYSGETLKKWKRAHEQLMHAWVQGRKKPYFELNLTETLPELAAEIISFFENQPVLFGSPSLDDKPSIMVLTENIKSFFENRSDDIRENDKLSQQVHIIELATDIFIAETIYTTDNEIFTASFAALQKLIGNVFAEMAEINKIKLGRNLRKLVPKRA